MSDRKAASALVYDAWLRETSKRITDLAISCAVLLKEHNDMVQRGDDEVSDTERAQRTQTIFDCVNDIGDKLEAVRQLEGLRQVSMQLAADDAGNEEPVERGFNA